MGHSGDRYLSDRREEIAVTGSKDGCHSGESATRLLLFVAIPPHKECMVHLHLSAAWAGILAGCISGALQGLFFEKEDWLGGYGSYRRRMLRLGHISFFGLAFLNVTFALSATAAQGSDGLASASVLLLIGAATMPLVCYLSAIRKNLRHLFPIPTGSLLIASALVLARLAR